MVTAGFQAVELNVHHVGDFVQRSPMAIIAMGKHPRNAFHAHAVRKDWVLENKKIIIEVNGLIIQRLAENDPYGRRQQNANDTDPPSGI